MQLRNSITTPTRLDEEPDIPNNRNATRPAHISLMKATIVPFNPDNPPAAFPSLPLTSKAALAAERDESEDRATEKSVRVSSLPTQTSLVGDFSEDEDVETYNRTSQIGLTEKQDSTQQDETPEGTTGREGVSVTSSLTAKSSTTSTPTGNIHDSAIEQDTTQRQEAIPNATARAAITSNKDQTAKTSTTTHQTVNIIALTPGQHATQDGRSDNAAVQANADQAQGLTNNNTLFMDKVAWRDLSLSMQYRIFTSLSTSYRLGAKTASQVLGLTQTEAAQIQQAVSLRALHPASLEEIRSYCLSISPPIPGIENQWSIDRDVHLAHVDYMTFAAHYEIASWAQVHLAEDFLSKRLLSSSLIGIWALDPAGEPGSEDLVQVPQALQALALARRNALGPSASSYVLGGCSGDRASPPASAPKNNTQPRAHTSTQKPTLPSYRLTDLSQAQTAARNGFLHPSLSRQFDTTTRPAWGNKLDRNAHPRLVTRHPLATVSTPGESPSPPRTTQGIRQAESSLKTAAYRHPISRSSGNTSAQAVPPSGLGNMPGYAHLSTSLASEARNAVKDTTNPPCAQIADNSDEEAHSETRRLMSTPTVGSQRLVLKVHQENGLAQVFRKLPPTASDSRNQTRASQAMTVPSGTSMAAENIQLATSQSGATIGDFPRELLEISQTSIATKISNSTADTHVTRSQDNFGPIISTDTAAGKLKRKPSEPDIRPDSTKIARTQVGSVPTTPPRGVLPCDVDNLKRLHSTAKRAHITMPMTISSENDPLTYCTNAVSTGKASEGAVATISIIPRTRTTDGDFPPSPTFSAISENEGLPEYQALLEPVKHRLRVKTSASSNLTPADPATFISKPHLLLAQGVAAPVSSVSGEASSDSPISLLRKKPQTLKLIVSKRSYDAAASASSASPGPATAAKELKKSGTYRTRIKTAQERREAEEALVARAAGISPVKK